MGYPIIMFEQQNATNIYTIRQEKFLKANNVRFLHLLLNIFYYFIINDDCFLFILIYGIGNLLFLAINVQIQCPECYRPEQLFYARY